MKKTKHQCVILTAPSAKTQQFCCSLSPSPETAWILGLHTWADTVPLQRNAANTALVGALCLAFQLGETNVAQTLAWYFSSFFGEKKG